MKSFLAKILMGALALLGVGAPVQQSNTQLGAYNPVTAYSSRLTQYVSASATTIPVASTNDKSGAPIVLANISPSGTVKVYLNISSGASDEEPIMCTGVTSVAWTNCTRGLPFQGSSEVASTTLQKAHNAGSSIIITNIGQFYNSFVSVDGDQIINNTKTFTSFPVVTSSTALPNSANQLATKYYVDNVGAGGFTSSNVSTSFGLRVFGTSPETVGVNASTSQGMSFGPDGKLYQIVSSSLAVVNGPSGIGVNTTTLYTIIATTTPLPNWIPITNASGTLDAFIGPATSSFPYTLNSIPNDNTWNTYNLVMIPSTTANTNYDDWLGTGQSMMHRISTGWVNMGAFAQSSNRTDKIGNMASTTFMQTDAYSVPLMGSSSVARFADTFSIRLKTRVRIQAITAALNYLSLGFANNITDLSTASSTNNARVAFYWDHFNTALIALVANGTAKTTSSITGITATNFNTYEIVLNNARADFWVNGVLKTSITSNLPTSGTLQFGFGGTTDQRIIFTDPIISQQISN